MNPKELKQKFCEAKEADRKIKKTTLIVATIVVIIIIVAIMTNSRHIGVINIISVITISFFSFSLIYVLGAVLIAVKYKEETKNTKEIFKYMLSETIARNTNLKLLHKDLIILNQYEEEIKESNIDSESDWVFEFSKDMEPFHSGERVKNFEIKNDNSETHFTTFITIIERKGQRTAQERFYD